MDNEQAAKQYALIIEAINNETFDNIVSITDVKRNVSSHYETLSRIFFLKSKDGIQYALSLAIDNLVNTFGEKQVKDSIIDNLGDLND